MIIKFIKNLVTPSQTSSKSSRHGTQPRRILARVHGINKKNVSSNAIFVCEKLQAAGYEAYIVGGAVRDLLQGLVPKDFDVATSATPEQVQKQFRRALIIGRRFRLVHVMFGRDIIETSTFRTSGETPTDEHGRVLRDNVFGTLADDAKRRDFTLNALYYDPSNETVIDYHGGFQDIQKKIVRIIGNAEQRYREDPVRMLRAIRFASKLNFSIEPRSHRPIPELAELLDNVPLARRFDEATKLLYCGHSEQCLALLKDDHLLDYVLPFFKQLPSQGNDRQLIELSLQKTDERIGQNKTVSTSFLYAALLWHKVRVQWQEGLKHFSSAQALQEAIEHVLYNEVRHLGIQRRLQSDMREIWMLQYRFEKRNFKTIWTLAEHPRFRAACDFLQLRAQCHEFDAEDARWWMDFANADTAEREHLIVMAKQKMTRSTDPAHKPKRRRYQRRSPSKTSSPVNN